MVCPIVKLVLAAFAFLAILQAAEAAQRSVRRQNGLQGELEIMTRSMTDSLCNLQNEDKELWERVLTMSSSMSTDHRGHLSVRTSSFFIVAEIFLSFFYYERVCKQVSFNLLYLPIILFLLANGNS